MGNFPIRKEVVAETKQVSSPVSKKPGRERRRSNRLSAGVGATLVRVGEEEKTEHILIHDISIHGVGFRCARGLEIGQACEVDMGTGPLRLCGRVRIVNCRARRDGSYDIGAEFV